MTAALNEMEPGTDLVILIYLDLCIEAVKDVVADETFLDPYHWLKNRRTSN
jgi:hypothetical protein